MPTTLRGDTLVARTARALAKLSLESEEGAFLGPEDELLVRLGISRPTFRQAAKMVENDRLITVRRGVKGGFYVSRPDAADAIRTLTRYLRLNGANLHDMWAVSRLIMEEAAGLAAACADEGLRARLDAFAAANDGAAVETARDVVRAETELAGLVAAMSGNPAMQLMMSITYSFGLEDDGVALFHDPAQRQEARRLRRELCRAILQHDAEVARVMMRRRAAAMGEWLTQAAGAAPP